MLQEILPMSWIEPYFVSRKCPKDGMDGCCIIKNNSIGIGMHIIIHTNEYIVLLF